MLVPRANLSVLKLYIFAVDYHLDFRGELPGGSEGGRMAIVKLTSLKQVIPEDVQVRARRAGIEDADWYAGRRNTTVAPPGDGIPKDHARLLSLAARQHRADRDRGQRIAKLVGLVRGATRRVRAAGS